MEAEFPSWLIQTPTTCKTGPHHDCQLAGKESKHPSWPQPFRRARMSSVRPNECPGEGIGKCQLPVAVTLGHWKYTYMCRMCIKAWGKLETLTQYCWIEETSKARGRKRTSNQSEESGMFEQMEREHIKNRDWNFSVSTVPVWADFANLGRNNKSDQVSLVSTRLC